MEITKRDYLLLLDNESRLIIKTNIADLVKGFVTIVSNFSEITEEMLKKTKVIFVLEPFLKTPNSFSLIKVYKKLYDLNIIYLGLDNKKLEIMKKYGRVFRVDVSLISSEVLLAADVGDESLENNEDEVDRFREYNDEIDAILDDAKSKETIRIARMYKELFQFNGEVYRRLQEGNKEVDLLKAENESTLVENTRLVNGYSEIIKKSFKLMNALKDYEHVLSKDVYEKIDLSKYSDKPLILYFKEYEELVNTDLFIETLFDVFRIQNKNSVKVLSLFDSLSSKRMKTLPSYYTILGNSYAIKDVINGDFIAKSGDYRSILDTILLNKVGINVLLIFDFKSISDVCVSGMYLPFALCRDSRHFSNFGLSEGNTITNGWYGQIHRPYLLFDAYESQLASIQDRTQRFLTLSSNPVFGNILGLARTFKENI